MNDEMRETMAAEFDRLQNIDDDAAGSPAQEAEIAEVAETPTDHRDEKGRFKSKATEEATTEIPETAVEPAPAEENTDPDKAPAVEAAKPIDMPASWSADAKEHFAKLPPETQAYLTKRESEREAFLTQKSQSEASLKQRFEPIDQILSPRKQGWAMQGMNESQAISQLLALSDFAGSKPQDFIPWFAKQHGIDLNALIPKTEPDAPALNPEIAPLYNEVNSLKQFIQTQQQQQEQAEQRSVFATIESFKQDPSHPHFDECWNEMSQMIPAIKAGKPMASHTEVLKEAYERATWANPAVRQRLLDAQRAEADRVTSAAKRAEDLRIAEAKIAEQKKLDAANAKKSAGTTIATKAAVGTTKPAAASMRDEMSRLYDELQGVA